MRGWAVQYLEHLKNTQYLERVTIRGRDNSAGLEGCAWYDFPSVRIWSTRRYSLLLERGQYFIAVQS